jgi:integrase
MAKNGDLPAIKVSNLLKAGTLARHRVSENLYLQVRGEGVGSWLFRYMHDGSAHWMGLGKCNRCSLGEARARARQYAQLLTDGIDPLDAKRKKITSEKIEAAKDITFGECAKAYIATHAPSWKNAKHAAQWHTVFNGSSLRLAATDIINDLPVGTIDTALALKVLEPIWTRTPETATRVRQRCEQVIFYAMAREYRDKGPNPFTWRGHLEKLLAKPAELKRQKGTRHHPALPYADMPAFMGELRGNRYVSARALEFTILTAARTSEVINATWDEIDFAEKTWTVPASRMKAGKEHRVPLSDRLLQILEELPREDGNPYLFIGGSGAPLSNMAMLELMKGLRRGFVPHGFRATFRTWAAERTNYPHHVCEEALAHTIPDAVVRSYQRGDLFDKRRQLMAAWSKYCAAPPVARDAGTVTPIRRRGRAS